MENALFGVEGAKTEPGIIWGAKEDGLSRVPVEAEASGESGSDQFMELLEFGAGMRDGLE